MNKHFMESHNAKSVWLPVDMNTADITGARVPLASGQKAIFVVHMGDSTAAVVTLTLRQHNAASAGTSKDLSVANTYYKKAGSATSFTKVEPSVAAAAYDLAADFADQEGIVVFEVDGDDLDVNNDFNYVSVDAADSTAAKLAGCVCYLEDLRNGPGYKIDL